MNKQKRNIIIFAIIAVGGGFLGLFLDSLAPPADPMQGLGVLLWLVSPLAANILLRAFGKDGWKDFGFKPHFKESWLWYLVSILVVPVIILLSIIFGTLFGALDLSGFSGANMAELLPLIALGFTGAMMKNIFEEFAWRGYLTPRLKAAGVKPIAGWIITGVIWAAWHIPYYLYFFGPETLATFTTLSAPVLIALAFIVLPFHAILYSELRLLSKSVWPVWLMHTIANAFSLPLIAYGYIQIQGGSAGAIFSPGTEGVIHSLLMGAAGLLLFRYRTKNNA